MHSKSILQRRGSLWLAMAALMAGLTAGPTTAADLIVARDGATDAVILVDAEAQAAPAKGKAPASPRALERQAAEDLAHYIELMTGAKPRIVTDAGEIAAALGEDAAAVFVVGELALRSRPTLGKRLAEVEQPTKRFDADAIVLERDGNRVYLAGSNARSHYFAVVRLLNLWGCHWYLPTAIGEVVPEKPVLTLGDLSEAYAPPFEVRNYWHAWNASREGSDVFQNRNFINRERVVGAHAIGRYVKELVPEGKTAFNVAIADLATAEHVANQIDERFAAGEAIPLGMDDGVYQSDSARDAELQANMHDKYFQSAMLTDAFMVFYNQVAEILEKRHPESDAIIGFLSYANITIPPQRNIKAADSLVTNLAPIDIDPIHSMNDPRSPSRQEYREMMYRWSEVMDGRVVIYDYDQAMLVWRDLPNPSHMSFRDDVQHYRKAGIMGISTETRGATATTFLNFHIRSQLMWNPSLDVDALLDTFYPAFYGPAADPMKRYWSAIYKAWEDTIVTEHEYYVIPAIYTRELVEQLRGHLDEARAAVAPLASKDPSQLSRNEKLYLERMQFTTASFTLIDRYTAMVEAGATQGDYAQAVQQGKAALDTRMALATMNPTFTTRVVGPAAEPTEPGGSPAWFPGEVKHYMDLLALTDGTHGRLVQMLPLEWAFRRDPHDTGLARGFARQAPDMTFWNQHKGDYATPEQRKDYPTTQWEMLRTDLYAQAQGVLHPDWQSFTGFMWYHTGVELPAGNNHVHIHFPGLFSEAWLYVNGYLVAHRPQKHVWWRNSYSFNWDVDLTDYLESGENTLTVRVHNTHHNGGMFRRPFLYEPVGD